MPLRLYTNAACLRHDTTDQHPERIARLERVLDVLAADEFADLDRREAPAAAFEQLCRAHQPDYVEDILRRIPEEGLALLDADTIISPMSGEAAMRAAGAVAAAVDEVCTHGGRAFCAVRPPGHHAEPNRAMGFCLFNSVAIGAYQARMVHGLSRVAVFDFDVHHGNGTQAAFEADGTCMLISTHQLPLFPGTGRASERGVGNILNLPLPPGAGSAEFHHVIKERALPELHAFRPELLLVSAGFDAHRADPLANLELETDDFAWVTQRLREAADTLCNGRIVSTLEGGYDLDALGDSVAAHVRVLQAD